MRYDCSAVTMQPPASLPPTQTLHFDKHRYSSGLCLMSSYAMRNQPGSKKRHLTLLGASCVHLSDVSNKLAAAAAQTRSLPLKDGTERCCALEPPMLVHTWNSSSGVSAQRAQLERKRESPLCIRDDTEAEVTRPRTEYTGKECIVKSAMSLVMCNRPFAAEGMLRLLQPSRDADKLKEVRCSQQRETAFADRI